MTYHAFTIRDVSGRVHTVNLSDDRRGVAMDGLPRNMRRAGARDQGEEDNAKVTPQNIADLVMACISRYGDSAESDELIDLLRQIVGSADAVNRDRNGENGRDLSPPMPRQKGSAASSAASFRGMPRAGASDSRLAFDDNLRSFAERHPDIWRNMSRVKTYGY
jgi:hypothetical protein